MSPKLLRTCCTSRGPATPTLDDIFFRLYHRVLSSLLLLASVLVLLREWSIDSIDCSVPTAAFPHSTAVGSEVSHYRINHYCKLQNTFLSIATCANLTEIEDPTRLQWSEIPKYQWFALIFLTAAIVFWMPHLVWSCCNRTMVKSVVFRRSRSMLRFGSPDQHMRTHLTTSSPFHRHIFTLTYLFLKSFSLLSLLVLITALNHLLHSHFLTLPLHFFDRLQQHSTRPLLVDQSNCTDTASTNTPPDPVFPPAALCPYTYLVPSAPRPQMILVNCLLPINSLLEQLSLFLWFTFALVLLFTALDLLRYLLLFLFRPLRTLHLKYNTNSALHSSTYLLATTSFSTWLYTSLVLLAGNSADQHHQFKAIKRGRRNLEVIEEEEDTETMDDSERLYEHIELQEGHHRRQSITRTSV